MKRPPLFCRLASSAPHRRPFLWVHDCPRNTFRPKGGHTSYHSSTPCNATQRSLHLIPLDDTQRSSHPPLSAPSDYQVSRSWPLSSDHDCSSQRSLGDPPVAAHSSIKLCSYSVPGELSSSTLTQVWTTEAIVVAEAVCTGEPCLLFGDFTHRPTC